METRPHCKSLLSRLAALTTCRSPYLYWELRPFTKRPGKRRHWALKSRVALKKEVKATYVFPFDDDKGTFLQRLALCLSLHSSFYGDRRVKWQRNVPSKEQVSFKGTFLQRNRSLSHLSCQATETVPLHLRSQAVVTWDLKWDRSSNESHLRSQATTAKKTRTYLSSHNKRIKKWGLIWGSFCRVCRFCLFWGCFQRTWVWIISFSYWEQKSPTYSAKEPYIFHKRALHIPQKSPSNDWCLI